MHPNNVCGMNKKEMLWRKDTRMPMCARRCVRVRVCVGEGFAFRVSFRVGACVWVRACVRVRVWVGWGAGPPVLLGAGASAGFYIYTGNTKG
jgi:hypothetical protein